MNEEFTGPLAAPLRDALARLTAAPGVSGVLIVAFTDDFKKTTVAKTIPRHLEARMLRALLEIADPPRIIVAN